MAEKIKMGISTCLLGEKVRYNGQHSLSHYLVDTLGQYFDYVPVCPEVECGMEIPREPVRLVGEIDDPRLMTVNTKIDHTDQMKTWANKRVKQLEKEELCGYIFKSKSPSSGMERVKVYQKNGVPVKKGVGMFARIFMNHFPLLPVEEEGRLNDPQLRENFIARIFILKRYRNSLKQGKNLHNLITFHTCEKLLLLSHSQEHYRAMGKLVAGGKKIPLDELYAQYEDLLMTAMKRKSTPKKNANVLQHMMGYFKAQLTGGEKQELLEVIMRYKEEQYPLIVPVTLMNHFVGKYAQPYLKTQTYLQPHPLELKLRNHG